MTIREIVRRGSGHAGHDRAWQVVAPNYDTTFTYRLFHHGHEMLSWYYPDGKLQITYISLGWGSVSDQNGMNQVLKELGVNWYYSRKGGAEILDRDWNNQRVSTGQVFAYNPMGA